MAAKVSFRLTTDADMHLPTYDHTKLSAINTCPTFGILRYGMHRVMPSTGRALALEAGTAMHECFSFIRLCSLMNQHDGRPEFQQALWNHHATRLFGADRMILIDEAMTDGEDLANAVKRGCIAVLDTSGFYDDPRDKRRTLSNLEECIYAYVNRWRWDHNVWMRDPTDPTSDVGIEIPFDIVCSVTDDDREQYLFRLTGRVDGIHYNTQLELVCHDNKTASRLNDAWSQSFLLSHQMTGYCMAASVFTGQAVNKAEIHGLAIPLPKSYDLGGIVREVVPRYDYHYKQWLTWLMHTIDMAERYKDDPIGAPKYTHSCNRYFRPCSFIPFCDNNEEEQRKILQEMVVDEWSPLHNPILDGIGNE